MSAWWLLLIVPVTFSFGFYFGLWFRKSVDEFVNGLVEAILGAACVFSEDEDGVIDVDCEIIEPNKKLEVKE